MKNGVPIEVLQHIKDAGIFQIFKAAICQLDHSLINALVERWRLEANTFHLPIGEATVTLQDVQVIWCLPIDGPPMTDEWVSETKNVDYWNDLCLEYLGFFPIDETDHNNLKNGCIKFQTLASYIHFTNFDSSDAEMCIFMARRIILAIIGSELFLDPKTYDVILFFFRNLRDLSREGRKSWGSATLAYLYRNLSKGTTPTRKGIDGPFLLLQFWAWERMPRIASRVMTRKEERERPYAYQSCLANRWNRDHLNLKTPTHVLTSYRSFFNALTNEQV
uniref:serine/threonine-protein phosphatase 7 long form homolog n=1 Tax=Erigeron canadensis TaxID=72917 RepID=UPI001CB90F94|nr:serine/threonine-protein phosphatase 7 long form homolog [Erigeron canadensis]